MLVAAAFLLQLAARHYVADLLQSREISGGHAIGRSAGLAAIVESLAGTEECGPLLLVGLVPRLAVEQRQLAIERGQVACLAQTICSARLPLQAEAAAGTGGDFAAVRGARTAVSRRRPLRPLRNERSFPSSATKQPPAGSIGLILRPAPWAQARESPGTERAGLRRRGAQSSIVPDRAPAHRKARRSNWCALRRPPAPAEDRAQSIRCSRPLRPARFRSSGIDADGGMVGDLPQLRAIGTAKPRGPAEQLFLDQPACRRNQHRS